MTTSLSLKRMVPVTIRVALFSNAPLARLVTDFLHRHLLNHFFKMNAMTKAPNRVPEPLGGIRRMSILSPATVRFFSHLHLLPAAGFAHRRDRALPVLRPC